jgi:hypothetical protein
MDHDAEIKRLLAAAAGIAVGECLAHRGEDVVGGADGLADDERTGVFQGLSDLLAARHLADSGVAGIIRENNDVAGEERRVCAAQIEEHAVAAGDGNHFHRGDDRRTGKAGTDRVLDHLLLPFVVAAFCYSAACIADVADDSFATSADSSAVSAAVRSVSGGRTGPESRPITFMPALMMETA